MKIFVLSPAVAILLSSCVTPNYVAPSDVTAKLTVTTNTLGTSNQQVRLFSQPGCADYPGKLVDLLQSKRVGINTGASTSTAIPAGAPITISVMAGVPRDDSFLSMFFKGVQRVAAENRVCEAFVTFRPEPGKEYRASYKIDGSPCSINVMQIENGQGVEVTNARSNSMCSAAAKNDRRLGSHMWTN